MLEEWREAFAVIEGGWVFLEFDFYMVTRIHLDILSFFSLFCICARAG